MTGEVPLRAARQCGLWRLVEAYHAVVYYAPERPEVYGALGLKGGWMGYFASRSAALGPVPADVVTACFYGFAPRMVSRALPDAWSYASPKEVLHARLTVVDRAMRRLLGNRVAGDDVVEAATDLTDIVAGLSPAGAPLFAAHRALPRPQEPHLALFWATSALRELRGDAHVAALRAAGVGPAESHVLMAAVGLVPENQRSYRGWTEEEWSLAADALTVRGWLSPDGRVTPQGRRERAAVEELTDAISAPAWSTATDERVARLTSLLTGVTEPIVTAGAVPYPNGMGIPPAEELAVSP